MADPFSKPSDSPDYDPDLEVRPEPSESVHGTTPKDKWEWEQALVQRSIAEGMDPTTQHIALLLASYSDADGSNIRPAVRTLMRVSGRGKSTVTKALAYLRDNGWAFQVTRGAGATRRASEYRLTIPPPKVRGEDHHQTRQS